MLAQFMDEPAKEGASFARVLALPKVSSALAKAYCSGSHPVDRSGVDCKDARIRVRPDGSVEFNPKKDNEGTFCVDSHPKQGEVTNGSGQRFIRLRDTRLPISKAICFAPVLDRAYRLPAKTDTSKGTIFEVELWAPRDEKALAEEQKIALRQAANTYGALIRTSIYKRAAWLFRQAGSATTNSLSFESFKADVSRNLPGSNMSSVQVRRDATKAALETLLANWPDYLHQKSDGSAPVLTQIQKDELCKLGAEEPRGHVGFMIPPMAQVRTETPGDGAITAALRRIALGHQPVDNQTAPWLLMRGEWPDDSDSPDDLVVIDVPARGGASNSEPDAYAKDRFAFFVHDLSPGQTLSDVKKGDKVEVPVSDWAKFAGTAMGVFQLASAKGVLPGSGHKFNGVFAGGGDGSLLELPEVRPEKEDVCGNSESLEKALVAALKELDQKEKEGPRADYWLANIDALYDLQGQKTTTPACWKKAWDSGDVRLQLSRISKWYKKQLENVLSELEPLKADASPVRISRVVRSGRLEEGHPYTLRVCEGVEKCADDTATASVTAETQAVTRPQRSLIGLSMELGYRWRLGSNAAPLGGYQFERVAGISGPTQLFELRAQTGTLKHFAFSPLLNLYPAHASRMPWLAGLGVGVGSTLFQDGEVEFLKEWNFRVNYEFPFLRDLLLSGGFSVRTVQTPVALKEGALLAVPAGQSPAAFATGDRRVWSFSLGMAVQLSIFQDALKVAGGLFSGGGSDEEKAK
ncbi:hypothetical protein D7X55_23935 [Corallococcus sp. AB049A]|uniref:hypothetical protein n=1 Tax=Corallococcus sp. AB049A TaxID=2316721 RepID=UPI000EC796BD|nr:hypothetical protein [Corallococcus sp. AB049A]RKI60817.1 hypothetical protein D7X55_23935 [Corallococcus sp. AB049A]